MRNPAGAALLVLLTTFLAACASPPANHWTQVRKLADGTTEYVDLDSVVKEDGPTQVWLLYDFASPKAWGADSFNSLRVQAEFACGPGLSRNVVLTAMTGPMGQGKVLPNWRNPGPTQVEAVAKGSPEEKVMRAICAPKPPYRLDPAG